MKIYAKYKIFKRALHFLMLIIKTNSYPKDARKILKDTNCIIKEPKNNWVLLLFDYIMNAKIVKLNQI